MLHGRDTNDYVYREIMRRRGLACLLLLTCSCGIEEQARRYATTEPVDWVQSMSLMLYASGRFELEVLTTEPATWTSEGKWVQDGNELTLWHDRAGDHPISPGEMDTGASYRLRADGLAMLGWIAWPVGVPHWREETGLSVLRTSATQKPITLRLARE